jgi:hypothetical protein
MNFIDFLESKHIENLEIKWRGDGLYRNRI